MSRLAGLIDRGLEAVGEAQATIRQHVGEIVAVWATLDVTRGPSEQRRALFEALGDRLGGEADPIRHQMAKVMRSFQPGLFVGGDEAGLPIDNLALERWFGQPKGHERRIHGHRHAGVRIVQEGATLLLALDAHLGHPGPFQADDLRAWGEADPPKHQLASIHRRKVMRKARSKKKRDP